MIYGYARVSTKGQARDGNSLEDQEKKLREAGCSEIYHDSYTGTKMDRPEFNALTGILSNGDRLVVTKMDRFARTAGDGIKAIEELLSRGVSVHILNMGLIDNTPTGRLMVTMLLAFAQFERDMIVERTTAGKTVAKENNPGWREGRKEKELDEKEVAKFREKIKKGELTVTECCKALGISRTLWYSRIKEVA